jgi:predicted RNase H-like HicB family nuclease
MVVYDLYLESGPKRRKTMVHVPDLLGCVANGPTTEAALDATPEVIRAYRRFLARIGEPVVADDAVDLSVVEHVTDGQWLGEGSPYIIFSCDLELVTDDDIEMTERRMTGMLGELATWADGQPDERLDAKPGAGRTAREILLHVIGAQGPALSIALGSAPGFGAIQGAAKRGERPLPIALEETAHLAASVLRATTEEQRAHRRELSSGSYTLRKSIRRSLEHAWEHLAELSRRPGGPPLESGRTHDVPERTDPAL